MISVELLLLSYALRVYVLMQNFNFFYLMSKVSTLLWLDKVLKCTYV